MADNLRLIACLVATLATIVAGLRGQPQQPTATGLIVGQVVDAGTGKPVSGTIVSIVGPPSGRGPGSTDGNPARRPRVLTGRDGRFVFRDLPRGRFSITARKPGYIDGAYGARRPAGLSQQIVLAEGERIGDVTVRLWKHAAVSGAVLDEAGEPLVGVDVKTFRRTFIAGRRRMVSSLEATTDDRGVYRIGGLVPGEYVVAVPSRQVAVPVEMAQAILPVGLPVENSSPLGLPGTADGILVGNVVLGLGRGTPIPPLLAEGRVFVYPATFHPSASASQAGVVAVAAGEERGSVDLHLQPVPTVRVSGSVVGLDEPTAVSVRLVPSIAADVDLEQDAAAAAADANGGFTFPTVPAGNYSIRVNARQRSGPRQPETLRWADLPLTVGTEDIEGLVVPLQNGLRISGHVEFEGASAMPTAARLQQVPVMIEIVDGSALTSESTAPVRLTGSGQFETAPVPAGKYLVRIGSSPTGWMFKSAMLNGRDISETAVELTTSDVTGVVITFSDRWTGLSGVVAAVRGGPDTEAAVLVFPTDNQRWSDYGMNPRRMRSTRTDRTGGYGFTSLPAGDYYVVALPEERAADWQDPAFLQSLVRVSTTVTIADGEHRTQHLRTRDVRQ